jgi:hypothetical protein
MSPLMPRHKRSDPEPITDQHDTENDCGSRYDNILLHRETSHIKAMGTLHPLYSSANLGRELSPRGQHISLKWAD